MVHDGVLVKTTEEASMSDNFSKMPYNVFVIGMADERGGLM